jgi:hypothetical protein
MAMLGIQPRLRLESMPNDMASFKVYIHSRYHHLEKVAIISRVSLPDGRKLYYGLFA